MESSASAIRVLEKSLVACLRPSDVYDFKNTYSSPAPLSSLKGWKPLKDVVVVSSAEALSAMSSQILKEHEGEVAFDLEMHGYDPSHLGMTCLIQLSTSSRCYVVDVLSSPEVWSGVPAALTPIFSDPSIVKIGHGISFDSRALHRDFGVAIVNVFDTHEAAKALDLRRTGLAHVCEYYGLEEGEEVRNARRGSGRKWGEGTRKKNVDTSIFLTAVTNHLARPHPPPPTLSVQEAEGAVPVLRLEGATSHAAADEVR